MSKMKNTRTMLLFLLVTMISLGVSAQNVTVKGTVKDKAGETVIGASVVQKGNTGNGTITDIDGNYSLNVPSNSTLIFSYVGMTTQEIAVKGQKTIDVILADDAQALEEVVVIGYGAVKRKDLTGSVATVNSEVLAAVPVASATEALTGKMAGVQITTTEGSPDAEMKIRVRGGGSITGDNTPLFIVDGFPVESISDIPASDIEDITVLKDASSTAIYGSRGANGVILVTTKSGKEGKVSVSYNAYYSWKKIAKTLDVLSPKDYAKWQYELAGLIKSDDMSSYENYFGAYTDMDMYDNIPHNDWQDLTFGRTGHTFNHNLNINGGSDKIRYAFSYSHMNDKAIMEGSNYKRDNFSLKLNTKPVKNVTLDFSARYSDTDIKGGGANDVSSTYDSDKRLKYAVIYTPIPLSNLDASAGSSDDDLGNLYHPLTAISDNDREQERKTLNIAGSFGWEIFKNFKIKTEVGYDDYRNSDQRYWGLTTYYIKNVPSDANQGKPAAQFANTSRHKFRNTNTISYDFSKLFKGDSHHLNAMIGHEWIITKSKVLTDIVHGFPESFTAKDAWKFSSQGVPFSIDNYINPDDKLLSYFGRINYDFQSKYLISATFRADGSSKFASGNQWGYFPSAAVAWRISDESFIKDNISNISNLKLRFGYGKTGNSAVNPYETVGKISSSRYTWGNIGALGYAPSSLSNKVLGWETTGQYNVGLDFGFFNGRISGSIEWYKQNTYDLLMPRALPEVSGFGSITENVGETENKGLEVTLETVNFQTKDFAWTTSLQFATNKEKIVKLASGLKEDVANMWFVGHPVDTFYDYVNTKYVWGYSKEDMTEMAKFNANGHSYKPGDLRFVDLDGNYKIDAYDRTFRGQKMPKWTAGMGNTFRYKDFDLYIFMYGMFGHTIYCDPGVGHDGRMNTRYADYWTPENTQTQFRKPSKGDADQPNKEAYWYNKGDFVRISDITLGYSLPKSIIKYAGLERARFYVQLQNPFTITGYPNNDPEGSVKAGRTWDRKQEAYSDPITMRNYIFGINLTF